MGVRIDGYGDAKFAQLIDLATSKRNPSSIHTQCLLRFMANVKMDGLYFVDYVERIGIPSWFCFNGGFRYYNIIGCSSYTTYGT